MFQTISAIDAQYSSPTQRIQIKIDVNIDREISSEEEFEISQMCQKAIKLLRKNTLLNDPEEQEGIKIEGEALLECFGSEKIWAKSIPNEYDPELTNPWFSVTTSKGPIKIGWRKRVINIDWSESDIKSDGRELFKYAFDQGETTTVGETFIHAWGYDKAKEYISKLLQ